jgi:uncharacterized protein (DUF885 family)
MRKLLLALPLLLAACAGKYQNFEMYLNEYVYSSLAFSPTYATSQGFYRFASDNLREALDDYAAPTLNRQRVFYQKFREGMRQQVRLERLAPEDRADHDHIQELISLNLFELEQLHTHQHNPTLYVEMIGNGLFSLYAIEFDKDLKHRFFYVVRRLEQIPRVLKQAKANLKDSPEIWRQVAKAENEGNIAMIDVTLRKACPPSLEASYAKAAAKAMEELRAFNTWLDTDLARRPADWRMRPELYARKFELTMGQKPGEVLAAAEKALREVQAEMAKLAGQEGLKAALERIARAHTTREDYFATAGRDLAEARAFVQAKGVVALTANNNLKVMETPVFMRGIYGVGGFNPAPALQPELGAQYWLTPIPAEWPADRVESKLREYNTYGLKLLTIHEAMPGHYVQYEWANRLQPTGRRMLRSAFGSGVYAEGWAVYITEAMLDAGYLGNSPDLRLTFLKQQLRVITNAILDIKLHTQAMTDEQAMALMMDEAYQEREEATAKLQRAKLSSCQLPTYFVGYSQFRQMRERFLRANPRASVNDFHNRIVRTGGLPVVIAERLLQTPAAETGK